MPLRSALPLALLAALPACRARTSAPALASGAAGGPAASAAASASAAPAACAPAAPRLGDSEASRALAAAPARCGQPAHRWLESARLGEVTSATEGAAYTAAQLTLMQRFVGGGSAPAAVHDVMTWRIRYTTQDRGKLIEATAAVALPTGPIDHPLDRVAVLHGTTGFADGCGPSTKAETGLLLAYVASLGYIAVGPDYLGLRGDDQKTGFPHPYLAGQPTAIASLDSLRAAARLASRQGQCPSARAVVIGGSQGGHAALWVDRLAPHYAAELDLRGVVATAAPADTLAETERALREPVSASASVAAMLAVTPSWYGQGDKLHSALAPSLARSLPQQLTAGCVPASALSLPTRPAQLFAPALLAAAHHGLAQQQPFGCMAAENGLTSTSVPRLPSPPGYGILFVLGESDTLVHTPTERAAYSKLCDAGLPLDFLECAGANHLNVTPQALPRILTFARARLSGEPFVASCHVSPPTACGASQGVR